MGHAFSDFGSAIIAVSSDRVLRELMLRCGGQPDEVEAWPIKFLREYLASNATSERALELAIRCTHRPTDLQQFLFNVYARHFQDHNVRAVQDFRNLYERAELIAVHVSCRPRLAWAVASAQTFRDHANLLHLFVVGQSSPGVPSTYGFDPAARTLTVPAPDTYEGLPQKVAAFARFLGFAGNRSCIMKLDDDVSCGQTFDPNPLVELTRSHDYMGLVIDAADYGTHRWHHFGKCQDPAIDQSPYSMVADCRYANGPAYFLSPTALTILAKASVYLCQTFRFEYYEDLSVGKVLRSFGIVPHHFDAFAANNLVLSVL